MNSSDPHTPGGIVYLDGGFLPRADARISVDDRGFVFGDGVYEVTRAVDGVPYEAEAHLARLRAGLEALRIDAGERVDGAALRAISTRLLEENGLLKGEAAVYLQVTRGAAPRTHHFPPAGTPPTLFLSASRFVPPAGVREAGGTAVTTPDLRWARCDLKTVNLLPNVLAKQLAAAAGAVEAVMVRDGVVTEGSHSSVFGVVDGVLRTHPSGGHVLPGITRAVVLRLAAALGMPVRESAIHVDEIPRLEELFVTGTTTDVTPLVRLDGRPVGDGRPGPLTRRLQAAHAAHVADAVAASPLLPVSA